MNVRNLPAIVPPSKRPNAGENTPAPNVYIPQAQWEQIQQAGAVAVEKLLDILESPAFGRLPVREQLRIIVAATDLAYKPNAALVRVHVSAETTSGEATNALKSLANKALELPELMSQREREKAVSPNVKPGDDL